MSEECKVEIAASQIMLALAVWIERSRDSHSQQEKTVEELISDFGLRILS